MRGFVLCAGFGTRLQPITDVLPKALVSVCGVPLMEIALRYLRKNAFDTYAVNIHYQAELAQMFIEQLPYSVRVFDEQPEILGTGGAIFNAKEFLGGDESFCVINADIVTNAPLKSLVEKFDSSKADVVLLASKDRGNKVIGISSDNRYVGRVDNLFGEMERSAAFIGIAFYKSEMLEHFQADDFDVKTTWKRLVDLGYTVEVWDLEGIYWQDTGTPAELNQLYWDIFDKKMKFDFPLGMNVDFEKKLAYPNGDDFDVSIISEDSEYLWIENVMAEKISGKNSVFHGGSFVEADRVYNREIITPWCEVDCK